MTRDGADPCKRRTGEGSRETDHLALKTGAIRRRAV
jgi:hypothetical protein